MDAIDILKNYHKNYSNLTDHYRSKFTLSCCGLRTSRALSLLEISKMSGEFTYYELVQSGHSGDSGIMIGHLNRGILSARTIKNPRIGKPFIYAYTITQKGIDTASKISENLKVVQYRFI